MTIGQQFLVIAMADGRSISVPHDDPALAEVIRQAEARGAERERQAIWDCWHAPLGELRQGFRSWLKDRIAQAEKAKETTPTFVMGVNVNEHCRDRHRGCCVAPSGRCVCACGKCVNTRAAVILEADEKAKRQDEPRYRGDFANVIGIAERLRTRSGAVFTMQRQEARSALSYLQEFADCDAVWLEQAIANGDWVVFMLDPRFHDVARAFLAGWWGRLDWMSEKAKAGR